MTYWIGWNKVTRQLRQFTIKKENPKTYTLNRFLWKLKKIEIGKGYFLTKKEALESAIRLQQEMLAKKSIEHDKNFDYGRFVKKVKWLKKRIEKLPVYMEERRKSER